MYSMWGELIVLYNYDLLYTYRFYLFFIFHTFTNLFTGAVGAVSQRQ